MAEGAQEQDEGPPGCHLQCMKKSEEEDTGLAHAGQVDETDEARWTAELEEEEAGLAAPPRSPLLTETSEHLEESVFSEDVDSFHHPSEYNSHVPPGSPPRLSGFEDFQPDDELDPSSPVAAVGAGTVDASGISL